MDQQQKHEEGDEVKRQVDRRPWDPELEIGASENSQSYPGITLLEERDRQRQQLTSRLQELTWRMKASEGYRIRNEISLLRKNFFIFDANHLNLKHILEEFEQPMVFLKLWDQSNHDKLDLFISEVIRYLHNYLAGAVTLLDHTRVFNDVQEGAGFKEEYQQRINQQFDDSPLPRFMEDLRTYMLHKELPFALAELNFSREGGDMELDSAIRVDVNKLRDWQGWSNKGREFLDTLDDKVRLQGVVDEYATILAGFYRWFGLRQSEMHQEALRDLEKLEDEKERLQQEMKRLDDLFEVTEKATSSMREEREMLREELRRERELTENLKAELQSVRRRWWRR